MFCKHCYCYCDTFICKFCHSIYETKCDTCGLKCNDTCLEVFANALKIK